MSVIWDEFSEDDGRECEVSGSGGLSVEQMIENAEKLKENIRVNVEEGPGWSAICVFGEGGRSSFTYTIGLERNFNHPELIIYGVEGVLAHELLGCAVEQIKEGTQFIPGERYERIMQEPYLAGVRDHPSGRPLNWATDFYGYEPQVVQLVWPDEKGLFEGEEGFNEVFVGRQDQQIEEV